MTKNPYPEYTFENWLKTSYGNDFSYFFVYVYNKEIEEGNITLEEFEMADKEADKIFEAKLQAFDIAVDLVFEHLKQKFLCDFNSTKQHERILRQEKTQVESQLNSDYEGYRDALKNFKDDEIITGEEFQEIEGYRQGLKKEGDYFSHPIWKNEKILAFARLEYLKWLEDLNPTDLITLKTLFIDNNSFSNLINKLTKLKISVDDETPVLIKNGSKTIWNKNITAPFKYLSAFISMLKEGGWIVLEDSHGKRLSERNLVRIIKNTFNVDIGRENAGAIKNERFNQKYYLPFFDILRIDNQANFQLLKSKLS